MSTLSIVLFSAAIAVVFTQGEIFKFLRRGPWIWRELASCALCSGVWLGAGMYLLFYGFPHAGGDLWTIATSVARVLGVGSLSGCVALIFVSIWEKLDERASSVQIETANMFVQNTDLTAQRVRFVEPNAYVDELPTDPSTSDSRLTKKVSTKRLPIEKSRRSDSDER